MAVVTGTESDDLMTGSDRSQAFEALGGNDTVQAGAEASCLDLSAGDDSGIGGNGNDRISGGDGDDLIQPGDGDDTAEGSLGKDYIVASAGNDRLSGGVGKDIVNGGAGNDAVFGAADADLLAGGPGSDRIDAADGYKDLVDCGTGVDRALADAMDVLKSCEASKVIKKKARAKNHAAKHEAARAALQK
jgi:Ca2+-binding RTX toxin-like protein